MPLFGFPYFIEDLIIIKEFDETMLWTQYDKRVFYISKSVMILVVAFVYPIIQFEFVFIYFKPF